MHARWVDLAVICVYVLGLTGIGLRFSRRQTTTERYFTAKRSVPSWAVGMSFLTAMITSVTFIAYPGAAYAKDWSLLVPGLFLLVALALVGDGHHPVLPAHRGDERVRVFRQALRPAHPRLRVARLHAGPLLQDGRWCSTCSR